MIKGRGSHSLGFNGYGRILQVLQDSIVTICEGIFRGSTLYLPSR